MPARWTILPRHVRLADIVPCSILVFTDDWSELASLSRDSEGDYNLSGKLYGSDLLGSDLPGNGENPTVGDLMDAMGSLEPAAVQAKLRQARLMYLPNTVTMNSSMFMRALGWGVTLALALTFTLAALWHSALALWVGAALSFIAVPAVVLALPAKTVILGQERVGVTPETVHAYALAVERGELWGDALPAGAPTSPRVQVDRIGQEYVQLRSDLVYRLECPALFDPAVATTAAFEAAMVAFEDEPSSANADRVELKFNLAREHAERVGLRHVENAHRDGGLFTESLAAARVVS